MVALFEKHIKDNFPFLVKAKILIAISGGIDSVVLTYLCKEIGLNLSLAHCNFNLRGKESDADEQFVKDLADKLDVPVYIESFDTKAYKHSHKLSTQIAARELRYNWFKSLQEAFKIDYVLTAHQADDNLETFLINLSRGTGIEGLTGIPEVNNNVVRPLLPFTRDQIKIYATENKIDWREDSSNKEAKYLRNKLRLEVLPALKEVNPTFMDNFNKTIDHLNGTRGIVNHHIANLKAVLFKREKEQISIAIDELINLNPRKDYLYELFNEFGFTAWDDVENLLFAMSGKQIFSHSHRMLKNRKELLITSINPIEIEDYYELKENEKTIVKPLKLDVCDVAQIGDLKNEIAYIDKDLLKYPLIIRKWKKGDYFYPLGMRNKKLLSKFFKDEKFSIVAKENTWILCSGDEIIWVISHRLDDRFKVTPKTKHILKLEYLT